MAIKIDRLNGQHYADNIVDTLLFFESGTWNTAQGSGRAVLDTNNKFAGDSSLEIENTSPSNLYTTTNSEQSTIILTPNDYQFSFYVKKHIALEVINGSVLIYKNALLLDTQDFSIGNLDSDLDDNNNWIRFQSENIYTFDKNDNITFQFSIKGSATSELTISLYFDGVMLNLAKRNNAIVPSYNIPNRFLSRFSELPDLPTIDGNYQLTVSSGVYTWTTI